MMFEGVLNMLLEQYALLILTDKTRRISTHLAEHEFLQ